ncbi:MAG: hypothetical protein ACI9MC_002289, partial [Kiritimatiellia bacterium]
PALPEHPMLVLLSTLAALAAPAPTNLTWDLTLGSQNVGTRSLAIRTEQTRDGTLRILQADTAIKANFAGMQFSWRQKLTANADLGPSSFIGVTNTSGQVSEIQGRRGAGGWIVSASTGGHETWQEYDSDAIDLSSADLLDPDSTVPIARFETARILSAETGQILTGTVEPLGPSEVDVSGTSVPVEGYIWKTEDGTARFFYTADGYLVRFETKIMGKLIAGTLDKPPPRGPDEQPVALGTDGIQEVEL